MEHAIKYIEHSTAFVAALMDVGYKTVQIEKGRKYDKVLVNDAVKFFIDRATWIIYGAKSPVQHNTRRVYGRISQISQFDWVNMIAHPNTELAADLEAREAAITAAYKKRGRPRKNLVTVAP